MEGGQGIHLGPGQVVQPLFAGDEVGPLQHGVHFRSLLEFASVDSQDILLGVAGQLPVQVTDFGVAQVQVEPEILPQETVAAVQGLFVERRVQRIGVEPLQQEVQRGIVPGGKVPSDFTEHILETLSLGIMVAGRQVGEAGDDVFEIAHYPNRSFLVVGRRYSPIRARKVSSVRLIK